MARVLGKHSYFHEKIDGGLTSDLFWLEPGAVELGLALKLKEGEKNEQLTYYYCHTSAAFGRCKNQIKSKLISIVVFFWGGFGRFV